MTVQPTDTSEKGLEDLIIRSLVEEATVIADQT